MRGFGAILLILCVYVSKVDEEQKVGNGVPLDADNEDDFWLIGDIVFTVLLRKTGKTNLLSLCIAVLFDVGLGAFEDDTTLLLVGLSSSEMSARLMA